MCEVDCEELLVTLNDHVSVCFLLVAGEINELIGKDRFVCLRRVPCECYALANCIIKFGACSPAPSVRVINVTFIELETLVSKDSLWFSFCFVCVGFLSIKKDNGNINWI